MFPAGGFAINDDLFRHMCTIFRSGFWLQLLYYILSVDIHITRVDLPVLYIILYLTASVV
jgi:hypothetical protein